MGENAEVRLDTLKRRYECKDRKRKRIHEYKGRKK
jgi:hypothetical protein